ncbi:transcription factor bHLH112-like isoform X2 [Andrographis paniculata]|uniref:transcription factor bHLH112-like isoform X2 n=1 Tax=Andrographis paniculata TaxID=175694 RepID=UPI0021E93D14|nr:transcription factor bHLH112-like isoform X2 [Andrographis paniculata]
MAEDFHGGVCGGSWWAPPPRNNFFNPSPCSYDISSFGWTTTTINNHQIGAAVATEMTSASDDSIGGGASDSSVVIHPHQAAGDGHVSVASTTLDMIWNHPQGFLDDNGRSEENYPQIDKINYYQDSSFVNDFRQMNHHHHQGFPPLQPSPEYSFPLSSPSYAGSLLHTLFDGDFSQMNLSEILPNLTDNQTTPVLKPNSLPKKQPQMHQFCNNPQFWNINSTPRPAVLPSPPQPQFRPPSSLTSSAKPNLRHSTPRHHNKETPAKKTGNEPAAKRARVETSSPMPAFKVRKEKLGDRVTALQQLVSPFGKTDTASVLQEAIEYIKFLHDQVNALSAPYLRNGSPPMQHQQVADDHHKFKDTKEPSKDLSSRGLCLVPISSTFPVASETNSDFWTPSFGGSFR